LITHIESTVDNPVVEESETDLEKFLVDSDSKEILEMEEYLVGSYKELYCVIVVLIHSLFSSFQHLTHVLMSGIAIATGKKGINGAYTLTYARSA